MFLVRQPRLRYEGFPIFQGLTLSLEEEEEEEEKTRGPLGLSGYP
jgi:hypothetical protein